MALVSIHIRVPQVRRALAVAMIQRDADWWVDEMGLESRWGGQKIGKGNQVGRREDE